MSPVVAEEPAAESTASAGDINTNNSSNFEHLFEASLNGNGMRPIPEMPRVIRKKICEMAKIIS